MFSGKEMGSEEGIKLKESVCGFLFDMGHGHCTCMPAV